MQHKDRSNLKYINWFWRLNARKDLDDFFAGSGRPAKEVTESMGMYCALRLLFNNDDFKGEGVVTVVGDGATPRTAALIAHLTKWRAFSVDPLMRLNRYNTKRLTIIKNKIENVRHGVIPEGSILISPHGHFKMSEAVNLLKPSLVITMPCCHYASQTLPMQPLMEYRDPYILSPHNQILVYKV